MPDAQAQSCPFHLVLCGDVVSLLRSCGGNEYDAGYCDLAERRLEHWTGVSAL